MSDLEFVNWELDEEQVATLQQDVDKQLSAALQSHEKREQELAKLKNAYKAKPEVEKKDFPWEGASNIVIPIVAITVDSVVARLTKAFLGTKDLFEPEIKSKMGEAFEKDLRDWCTVFMNQSGSKDRIRTGFHDMAEGGDCFIKPIWTKAERPVHFYGDSGAVVTTQTVDYEGIVWYVVDPRNVIWPRGFGEWARLPWIAERVFYTEMELREQVASGAFDQDAVEAILKQPVTATDKVSWVREKATPSSKPVAAPDQFALYEITGKFHVPGTEGADAKFEEVILTYSTDARVFTRKVLNPFFGKPKSIYKIPYLRQPHEIEGLGVGAMSYPFQIEASTGHNQTIDAATAAIAGIFVVKPGTNLKDGDQIYPGRKIVTDDPMKDVNVVHLSMGNSTLPNVDQAAAFWNEKRSGVSAYNMGVESPVAGSRATATGTTALISEGNIRFWVSIDDMRDALTELMYATLTLSQQYKPEGLTISADRVLKLPQGDLRQFFGLNLAVTSEKINRDIEIQNFQILINALNEYYARLMQAAGMIDRKSVV